MSQTPRTGTGDSAAEVDVIDAQLCICQGHLSMCGTFLVRLLSPPDIPLLLPTPKENYSLNLSKVTSGIWSFRIVTAILGTKNWYNFVHFHALGVAALHKQTNEQTQAPSWLSRSTF